jgi:hypothetical protein
MLTPLMVSTAAVAADASASVLGPEGTRLQGEARLEEGRIHVDRAAVPLDHLIALDAPGAIAGWVDQGVVLLDGQVIRGIPRALKADVLEFASDLLGPLSLPLAQVSAVIFTPVRTAEVGDAPAGFAGVMLINGDRVKGVPSSLTDRAVGIDNGRKVVQVPRARVRLLALHPIAAPETSRQCVRLGNGDRLAGVLGTLDGEQVSIANALGSFSLPAREVRALWSEGGPLVPLERIAPAAVADTPQFSEHFPVAVDHAHGEWLIAGGRRYEHGIASHATERLTYDIGGAYSTFVAEAGLAPGPGSAVMKVVVDGKTAFDSGPIAPGDAPRPVRVSVAGAQRVDLVVEAGPDGDAVGDYAIWGWPMLVKP